FSNQAFYRWIGFSEDDELADKAARHSQRVEPSSPRYSVPRDKAFHVIRTFRAVLVPIGFAAIWNRSILSASQCWRFSRSCLRLFFSTFSVSGFGHGSQMRQGVWERWLV